MRLTWGDSLEKLKELGDNSVDSVVTDPPYGLAFMGKKWDYDVPSVELWREVLRVLKPGGHLLSFGGTRTYHRMVVNIEDAGFEIRDQIMWIYGSGFPKSLDVSKAIDKAAGATREKLKRTGKTFTGSNNNIAGITGEFEVESNIPITATATAWQGWGTALKPANEPIVLARKPLEKGLTVAENVLKWGCGGLNIDGTRIAHNEECKPMKSQVVDGEMTSQKTFGNGGRSKDTLELKPNGRWPANVLFDEEAAAMLDEQSGERKSGGSIKSPKSSTRFKNTHSQSGKQPEWSGHKDSGGASRFFKTFANENCEHGLPKFWCPKCTPADLPLPPAQEQTESSIARFFYAAKASKRERNAGLEGIIKEKQGNRPNSKDMSGKFPDHDHRPTGGNNHPTVKPIKLMEYLIKLVTPPKGTVLDPFMGSGTTGCAAVKLGFNFIGIEREQEYVEIAKRRIEHWKQEEEETCPDEKNQLTMNI